MKKSMIKNPVFFLLAGVALISFSPIFVKLANTASNKVGFYRNFFGLLFLIPYVLLKRRKLFTDKFSLILPFFAGLVFFLDLFVWHKSIMYVGPGIATLLGNFQVFFVSLFGFLFLKERLSWQFAISVPIALTGIFFIVGKNNILFSSDYGKGILLGLLTAVFYSIFLLIIRGSQARKKALSPDMNLVYITISATLFFALSIGASSETNFAISSKQTLWALLAYGFITHFIGWIIISKALPQIRATVAGIILLLQPILSFVWEVIIFNKHFTPIQITGAIIAIIAIYIGMHGQRKK